MSHLGKSHLMIMWTVGPEDVAEADRLFVSHAEWVAGHPREGNLALLDYAVSKGPELSNPLDPSSEPTGKTTYVLNEYYASPDGIGNHWQETAAWSDMAAMLELSARGTVTTLHNGTAVQSLS